MFSVIMIVAGSLWILSILLIEWLKSRRPKVYLVAAPKKIHLPADKSWESIVRAGVAAPAESVKQDVRK